MRGVLGLWQEQCAAVVWFSTLPPSHDLGLSITGCCYRKGSAWFVSAGHTQVFPVKERINQKCWNGKFSFEDGQLG